MLLYYFLYLTLALHRIACQDGESTEIIYDDPPPRFRILAPQFVCPTKDSAVESTNDKSVIMFQMPAGSSARIVWTVRWRSHGPLAQRTTLLLWRAVRQLEASLNSAPSEPYTYVIDNGELLPGIDYLFNMTAVSAGGVRGQEGNFSIAYEDGRRKLDLHAEVDDNKMSVLLLGSETAYAHAEYVLRAQLTMCQPTEDYHFVWNMRGTTDPSEEIDLGDQSGSRLLLPAGTLRGGHHYDVSCRLYRTSDTYLITTAGLFVAVLRRGLELQLGCDELATSVKYPVQLTSILFNYDELPPPFSFEWSCTFNGETCSSFESVNYSDIYLKSGFPEIGQYELRVTVTSGKDSADATVRVIVVEASLPILQVQPVNRLLNEDSEVELVAVASNIAPSCSLSWYFASTEQLSCNTTNDASEECEHGELLGQTVTVYSMDETFLSELADYSNETESRELRAQLPAAGGRARLSAVCGCSETFSCETEGTAYADVSFRLNASPKPGEVTVSPGTGVALETVFRLSTRAVEDLDPPVRYTFHYTFGNFTLVTLGSYVDHVADETVLPYIEGGVSVGVTVCDVWGACGRSAATPVAVAASDADASVAALLVGAAAAQLRRCELDQLESLAVSALLTFANAQRAADLESYSAGLVDALRAGAGEPCIQQQVRRYHDLLDKLAAAGLFQGRTGE